MLTTPQLAALHRALRAERVLSVYIDGSATDPAIQRAWRTQLDHALSDIRQWLAGSPTAEREQFESCVRRLDATLASIDPSVGAPGWAAFITADGVREAHTLPAPTPTLAVWSNGPCVAPYVRALKQMRTAVVAVLDSRRAKLYQYREGTITLVDTVRAHHPMEPPSHMGTPARQGFHGGTRGTTGRDAAQRTLLRGRERMVADAVARMTELAGPDGWILLAGTKRIVASAEQHLAGVAPQRVRKLESVDVHASDASIAAAAHLGVSALRDAFDSRRIATIGELAGAHGLGALGPADTRLALDGASVRELFLTDRYRDEHAAEAEDAVRRALDQDAAVEVVSGDAALELGRHGGLAAALRFRPATMETPATV